MKKYFLYLSFLIDGIYIISLLILQPHHHHQPLEFILLSSADKILLWLTFMPIMTPTLALKHAQYIVHRKLLISLIQFPSSSIPLMCLF